MAQAEGFIDALPDGLDTVVGERGLTLSGGQRQRLAIARALITDPRVLILDEATASVDASTEREIQAALAAVMAGRTTLVIAHRLSTVSLADELVVLEDGRIVARGTHEELYDTSDTYREIHDGGLARPDLIARGRVSTAAPRVGMREIPAPPVERRKLRRLLPYFRPYRWRAIATVMLMLVVTACGLAVPALAQFAIDHGITARDKGMLILAVVLFVIVGLVGWLAGYYQTFLSSWVGERVLLDLRTDTFRHLMRLELGYHERTPTGRTVSRLTSDIEALDQLVTDGVTSLVVNGLTFLGVIVILFTYDVELALVTLVIFPPLAIGTAFFRVYSTRAYRRTRERVADVLSTLQETLSGIRVVQGFGRQEPTERLFREVNEEYREANMSTIRLSGTYFPGVEFLSGIGTAIVLYFGSTQVLDKNMSIGVMVAFIGYLSSFFDPIQQLSQLYNTFQSAMAALEKIFGVLDTSPELVDAPGAIDLPRIEGDVELRDVNFGYTTTPVLHDVSLHIAAGETIALVGTTGAGKSTLAKIVARFYDPASGARC